MKNVDPWWGLIPIVCRGRGKVRSAAGNAVTQGQQGVHKVDVLKEHAGDLRGQLHVGEVPEAPDAQVDKLVRQGLGLSFTGPPQPRPRWAGSGPHTPPAGPWGGW